MRRIACKVRNQVASHYYVRKSTHAFVNQFSIYLQTWSSVIVSSFISWGSIDTSEQEYMYTILYSKICRIMQVTLSTSSPIFQ